MTVTPKTPAWLVGLTAGALLVACVEPPPVLDYPINAPPPPLEDFEARADLPVPPLPDGLATLSGQVKNWVSLAIVDGATVQTYGVAPQGQGVSDAAGGFAVEVPAPGVLWAYATKAGYASTYDYVSMPAGPYNKTLYLVSEADLGDLAAAFGVTPLPGCGTVLAEVRNAANAGEPDVPSVKLEPYGLGAPDVEYRGPYYLNAQNQPEAALTDTSESGRVVFFNVCDAGSTTIAAGRDLTLTVEDPAYGPQPSRVKMFPAAATRGVLRVDPDLPPPPPPEPPEVAIDFAQEIYPIFVANACAACHYAGGTGGGGGLYFDRPPAEVYGLLREGTERVSLADPAESLVLTKPLLEDPPNHPNASFPSVLDPSYVTVLRWIEQGAPYGVEPPPPLVEPVGFYEHVYDIFQASDAVANPQGRGCTDCHNAVSYSGSLDLTGGPEVVLQRIVDKNLYDLNYPDRSALLRNPYCGPAKCAADPQYPETHPAEVFANTDDPGYQTVYQWIAQGAIYRLTPPPPPDLPVAVDFFDNVQSRFAQRGCVGCHNAASNSGGLDLTGRPYDVYQRLTNPAYQRVVPNDYEGSYLYSKPLAEVPDVPHSGGKVIPNAEDAFARYVAGWIYEGAEFVDPGPMNFPNGIVPIFGPNALNCTGCHNQANPSGGLALDGTPDQILDELTVEEARVVPGDPMGSPLLMKAFDLFPDVQHSGGKKAMQTEYKAYHRLATWIFELEQP